MKSFVVDASVTVKWLLSDSFDEDHVPQALSVLRAIRQGIIKVIQPPHWLAETASVITRLRPKIAKETIELLYAMELNILNVPEVYITACKLAEKWNCHVFDTLYHAVALCAENTWLVTADEKYYKKTFKTGNIVRLADFSAF